MAAALCTIELVIPAANSLKDKRQVLRSLLDRIRSRCGAAVAETDHQDTWQRATVEAALVGSSRTVLAKQVELLRRVVDDSGEAAVAVFDVEYL
jgi:uncharacterized protein YlxP (DUF503 family)